MKFRRCENDLLFSFFFDEEQIHYFLVSPLYYLIYSITRKAQSGTMKSLILYIRKLTLELHASFSKIDNILREKILTLRNYILACFQYAFFSYLSIDMFYLKKQNLP